MFSYFFLKFIFLILFFEDVFFLLEVIYFIVSDLSVFGKKVVKFYDKNHHIFYYIYYTIK